MKQNNLIYCNSPESSFEDRTEELVAKISSRHCLKQLILEYIYKYNFYNPVDIHGITYSFFCKK